MGMNGLMQYLQSFVQYPAAYGALPQLYAATAPENINAQGKVSYIKFLSISPGTRLCNILFQFFVPWSREGPVPKEILDPNVGERLWEWLEKETATKGL
jgi:retinol dehydrogenase 12